MFSIFSNRGLGHSAALRALPRLRLGHLTADKREIKDFPKSRQVGTSFIRKTLCNKRAPLMDGAFAGPRTRLWDSRGPVNGTEGRSRLWDGEVT